jgi:hypothetical protein
MFAVMLSNLVSVVTIVEVMVSPDSNAWISALVVGALIELGMRTGASQRVQLWAAQRLVARVPQLEWILRLLEFTALRLTYVRTQATCGFVVPVVALCIGGLRAVTFADARCLVWLDVSPTVYKLLIAQTLLALAVNALVWLSERRPKAIRERRVVSAFRMTQRFSDEHPLRSIARRPFEANSYAFAYGVGAFFLYIVLAAFIGPDFVTGLCPGFSVDASTFIWVLPSEFRCGGLLSAAVNATNRTI